VVSHLATDAGESEESASAHADAKDSSTRSRVIRAAIDCILEEGFYRASSNMIARRAGVTWGVIQYHFGTREGLLVAAYESSGTRFEALFANAEIRGETVRERVESLADVIWAYYRVPEFLAFLQLGLNLSHDPTCAERSRESLRAVSERFARQLPRLTREVVGDQVDDATAHALFSLLFSALRGLALDHEIGDAIQVSRPVSAPDPDPQRAMLVDALSAYVERLAGG
jgi:AcrR family transcriptional regulator